MKIYVKENGKTIIWLVVPNTLLTSRHLWLLVNRCANNRILQKITEEQLKALVHGIRRSSRCHHGLELIRVESGDGDMVSIVL